MGGGNLRRRNHQVRYIRGATGLNYSPSLAQPSQDSQVKENKKDHPFEEQILLERLEINHQGHKLRGRGGL